jgi:hypothetical protein
VKALSSNPRTTKQNKKLLGLKKKKVGRKKRKLTQRVRSGGEAQVVEYLPSKCKALQSNPCTTKKTKQKQKCDFSV